MPAASSSGVTTIKPPDLLVLFLLSLLESSAFMILWTAFSGVVIYYVDDHLGWQLMLWCVGFGFVSGQLG